MQINILWAGLEYNSLENCLVKLTHEGTHINSTIVGEYESKIYTVVYRLITNENWETICMDIEWQHSNKKESQKFESDGTGNWIVNGKAASQFKDCIDVDLSLSPFTNSLPINRLKLGTGESCQISVIYFDLLRDEIGPAHQNYTKLSSRKFKYENLPNDFEAEVSVDDSGLVVDYPKLFVRRAALQIRYD